MSHKNKEIFEPKVQHIVTSVPGTWQTITSTYTTCKSPYVPHKQKKAAQHNQAAF